MFCLGRRATAQQGEEDDDPSIKNANGNNAKDGEVTEEETKVMPFHSVSKRRLSAISDDDDDDDEPSISHSGRRFSRRFTQPLRVTRRLCSVSWSKVKKAASVMGGVKSKLRASLLASASTPIRVM
eukprot:759560-Prorocentrum_minimum.AAC.1